MKVSINKTEASVCSRSPTSTPLKANPGTKRLQLGILTRLGMPTSQQETGSHWHHTQGGQVTHCPRLSSARRAASPGGRLAAGAGQGSPSWEFLGSVSSTLSHTPWIPTRWQAAFPFLQIHTVHSLTWGRRLAIFYDDCYPSVARSESLSVLLSVSEIFDAA